MKKIIAFVLLLIIAALLLTGCARNIGTAEKSDSNNFLVVDQCGSFYTVVDTRTGVMYAVSNGGYNRGTVTPLIDSYGNPYIYPAFDAREDKIS